MPTASGTADRAARPVNIVLLSDGTGNSAAKLFKTNVWRLYDALELDPKTQVALYDDGVGTAAFKPLALLGGAFGWGLKRNVLDLYTFLCRNYWEDGPGEGDPRAEIFVLGFSRGAFTARIVADLIARVGVIPRTVAPPPGAPPGAAPLPLDPAELRCLAAWAYRDYRRKCCKARSHVRGLRNVRDAIVRAWDWVLGRKPYDPSDFYKPPIAFVGVWDTVSAYGLPIQELTRGWERWIWPTMPTERRPSPRIRVARQALALDDERQTFFPHVWDERPSAAEADDRRDERLAEPTDLQQVWFAGAHSDVGGGYPNDGSSYTPLVWIARAAADCNLRFRHSLLKRDGIPADWIERAKSTTPLHDSRQGLGVYYRYNPRLVDRLCRDASDVPIAAPLIHHSVFDRIEDDVDGYAPTILPEEYSVVLSDGNIVRQGDQHQTRGLETADQRKFRLRAQDHALNTVWFRRIVYFLTVGVTLAAVLFPLCPARARIPVLPWPGALLASAINALGAMVPFSGPWVEHYQARPYQFAVAAGIIVALLALSNELERRITNDMRRAWTQHDREDGAAARHEARRRWSDRLLDRAQVIRTNSSYKRAVRAFSQTISPNAFALAIVLTMLVGVVHFMFSVAGRMVALPASSCGALVPAVPGRTEVALWPDLLCTDTGIDVVEGQTYEVEIAEPIACASDELFATTPPGRTGPWTRPQGLRALTLLPLRRAPHAGWFAPIAIIGQRMPERHVLAPSLGSVPGRPTGPVTFTAGRSGRLALAVNDAIAPPPFADRFYADNTGGPARVRIRTTAAATQPPLAPYPCEAQHRLAIGRFAPEQLAHQGNRPIP